MEKILLNLLLFVCAIPFFGCSGEYQDFTLGQNDDAYKARIAIESCNSGLSVSAKDRYRIELKLYKDGKLVAEDFVSYPKKL